MEGKFVKNDHRTIISKRIMLSMVLIVSFVLLILIYTAGCSNSDNNNESGTSEEITGTIDEAGGNFEMGQINVEFPADSVGSEVSITGKPVFLDSLPEDLTPISSVFEISLSDLEAYISHSAILTFNLKENTEGEDISIYHSSDGVTWEKLESTVEGNTVSTSIPNFSYFVAARGRTYSLRVINNSSIPNNACIYQFSGTSTSYQLYTIVWKSKYIHPGCTAYFKWSKNYSFFYSKPGRFPLRVGETIGWPQFFSGDLSSKNKITLTGKNYDYFFTNLTSGDPKGSMTIVQDSKIRRDDAVIGIAMDYSPICAAQAWPNMTTQFSAGNMKCHIFSGNYRAGTVINAYTFNRVGAEVAFPPGI